MKIWSAIILVSIYIITGTAIAGTDGKVSGYVHDVNSKEPLIGATILIKGSKLGAATEIDGSFYILKIPPGVYDITASMVGYATLTQSGVIVNDNRTTNLNFELKISEIIGEEVTITATRPDVEKDKTSTSQIIRSEEVSNVAGIKDVNDLLGLVADVNEGHFRGGREGEELYTLNGVNIINPLNSMVTFSPIMSAVEEVEVITSGFSAQYGNAQSGVVNISMREGSRDRWQTRAEMRSRVPGYKHFGPSPYDMSKQPYLQVLNSPEKWLATDTVETISAWWTTLKNGFDQRYVNDSVLASQVAYALWNQVRRNINRNYNNVMDYSFEATAGGPVNENIRLFIAGQVDNSWPSIPTPEPETKRQLLANLAFDLSEGMSLRLSTGSTTRYDYLLPSGANSYFRWLWDMTAGLSKSKTQNNQFGVRFAHTLSKSAFYEIRLSRLETFYSDGYPIIDQSRYGSTDRAVSVWPTHTFPDGFSNGLTDNDIRREKTITNSLNASFTSQLTSTHMLLAGLQANQFNINVKNRTNLDEAGAERDEFYSATPYEMGVFVQDKMEFQGMIANVGLRLDAWNPNIEYYKNPYAPFRIDIIDSANQVKYVYDPNLAEKEKTKLEARLQPRVGISFPVSENTVFHLNYGLFVQRAPFQRIIYARYPIRDNNFDYTNIRLGNPRLKAEETNSYDVGVMQALGEGFTFDLSGYYKDVKNLIQATNFFDLQGYQFSTYTNRDYADIRGFQVVLSKKRGTISGSISYNYSVAKGKSATPFDATPSFYEPRQSNQQQDIIPDPKDILMDFDRTHNLIAKIILQTPEGWGVDILNSYPFERINISLTSTIRSGRPYTYDTQGLGLINNKRAPMESNTNMRITKNISQFFSAKATFYLEIMNLFNVRNYSYGAIFQKTSSSTGIVSTNPNLEIYEKNPERLKWYPENGPFFIDRTFMLYSNAPRSFNIGIVVSM